MKNYYRQHYANFTIYLTMQSTVSNFLVLLSSAKSAIQTARMAYAKALQAVLPTAPVGNTLKFN